MNRSTLWLLVLGLLHTAVCDDCSQVTSSTRSCSMEGQVCIVQTPTMTALNTGRVQICKGGVWGTLANENFSLMPWSEKNAQVACIQAGFSGAINSIYPRTVRAQDWAAGTVPVHYAGVICRGSEGFILDCDLSSDGSAYDSTGTYSHVADAYVVCRPKAGTSDYSDAHVAGIRFGDLRLFGDPENGQGAVEIYTEEFGWSPICPDGFDSSDATVICEQFGYEAGSAAEYDLSSEPNSARLQRVLSDAVCTERTPDRVNDISVVTAGKCVFSRQFTGTCPSGSQNFAGVQCSSSISRVDGDIRLFGGTNEVAGIVEVFYNGKWGPVCERFTFALTEARTVCEQLDLDESDAFVLSATSLLDEESALKAVWLSGVDCSSDDDSFTGDCDLGDTPVGYGECRSSDLAAVQCGRSSSGSFSSGGITGIVFAIIFVVFFILPLGYYFGRDYWRRRHQYGWYNTLTTPSEWCDCVSCPNSSTTQSQRTFNLQSNRTGGSSEPAEVPLDVEPTTAHTFGGFTGTSSTSSRSAEGQPPAVDDLPDPGLTKVPPPNYTTAENFPSVSAVPQDLPPPYPGPDTALPPLGFAFPPPTSTPSFSPANPPSSQTPPQDTTELSAPPPTALGPSPTYGQGEGQATVEASAPPPSPGYPLDTQDPAYPPPPANVTPGVPYPLNFEYGGGAYPPPTAQQEPSS